MSTKIKQEIQKNYSLIRKIEKSLENIGIQNSDNKVMLLMGYYKTSLSHFLSINILTEKKLYNSSFSLMRNLFESFVKGIYMRDCLTANKIDKLMEGKENNIFPNTINEMTEQIDSLDDVNYFTPRKEKLWKMMNDYTHTGVNQLARNFNEYTGEIAPNFSEDEIVSSLIISNEFISTFTNFFCGTLINGNYGITKENCRSIFNT